MKNLFKILSKASTEEELKNLFANFFSLKLDTKNYIDLYTAQILFEFKLDANLKNIQTRAICFAQTLYYIRRLKYGREARTPSRFICVVTKNFSIISPTSSFSNFYLKSKSKNYDWDLIPSSPCKKLIEALSKSENLNSCHVYDFSQLEDEKNFITEIKFRLTEQIELFTDKKIIDENNFYPIFELWKKFFGASVEDEKKSSEYFITDIEEGKTEIISSGVLFHMSNGEYIKKFIDINEYKNFWCTYEKIYDSREIVSIRQKMDRMTEIDLRRRTGEFFTPIKFAEKAIDYISRTIGDNWYKSEKFRLWDMAAGTGNLEFALPAEALKYCYISTLLKDDADYCKKIFSDATCFQYDYLNDDVNFFGNEQILEDLNVKRKMPSKLIEDLKNPSLKWIILINPPYATASSFGFKKGNERDNKIGVSLTKVRDLMTEKKLGEASRELYVQFIYRICLEFKYSETYLGIFSKLNYIASNNYQKFRTECLEYKYERGFMISAQNFEGCNGQFPVAFSIWNLNKNIPLAMQTFYLDIYNDRVEKIAVKRFQVKDKSETLNKWIKRPSCTKIFPPMSSALNNARGNKDVRDRVAENFLASLMCNGNSLAQQSQTALLSGPGVNAGSMSIVPENFESSMIIHTVRRLPKVTWKNSNDQFMQPTKKLSEEFITDAVIWSLFASSNQTVSLRSVEYKGEFYNLKNNFFPFLLEELRGWECSDAEIRMQLFLERENRFAALWLKNKKLSLEALEVLEFGRILYKEFYKKLSKLNRTKLKILNWDVGFYQVRMSLGKTVNLKNLSNKLLPKIYELGFLRDEVKYF